MFFDLETTGVDVNTDRIVEIALVKVDHNLEWLDTYHKKINPIIPIPKGASDVHGITDEMVKDEARFSQIASEVYEFLEDCDLAGYNSNRFDIPLLVNEFKRADIEFDVSDKSIVDIYQVEVKFRPNTLSAVYERHTGRELDGAHGALTDTEATIQIFKSQMLKYELPREFDEIEDTMLGGEKRLDLGGKLKYVDGIVTWAFGKHVDKPVYFDPSYTKWVIGADFPEDLKTILKQYV